MSKLSPIVSEPDVLNWSIRYASRFLRENLKRSINSLNFDPRKASANSLFLQARNRYRVSQLLIWPRCAHLNELHGWMVGLIKKINFWNFISDHQRKFRKFKFLSSVQTVKRKLVSCEDCDNNIPTTWTSSHAGILSIRLYVYLWIKHSSSLSKALAFRR